MLPKRTQIFISTGIKGDLKSFQENVETFFISICHDLTPVNERVHKKEKLPVIANGIWAACEPT